MLNYEEKRAFSFQSSMGAHSQLHVWSFYVIQAEVGMLEDRGMMERKMEYRYKGYIKTKCSSSVLHYQMLHRL